jgi:hypothetical protein
LIPGDHRKGAVASRAAALEWLGDAVGVIGDLNCRLTARTQTALVDRVRGVAFELLRDAHTDDALLSVARRLDISFHDANAEAAAAGAHRTDARLPLGHARHQFFLGHEADQLVLGAAAARERCGGPGNRRELDERTTVHQ